MAAPPKRAIELFPSFLEYHDVQSMVQQMDDIKPSERQINICFISLGGYLAFSRREEGVQGGSEVDIYMLSTELAKDKRFKVSLITGDFGQNKVESFENVTIYKTARLSSPLKATVSIWRVMKEVNADIYFKKGASFVTALAALFCRVKGKFFMLRTAQDIECNGVYIREKWLRGKAFKWTLKQAKHVFVQNNSNKSHLKETTGISATVIPNGHRMISQTERQRDFILWVGRSTRVKRPELFVRLASENPSEQFVMICQQAGDDNDAAYRNLVEQAKLAANLKFIERVPFLEIMGFFQRAKVFVNTSDTEGFPNVFIQSCLSGTPILSLNVNPDDFLNKYECGLCAKGDWEIFREMLSELLRPDTMKLYGENGREYAVKNHDIQNIIEKYKTIFAENT
ncbi:MAG: glycosyltransferase family 4 protein [Sedimentisphaerales bacterium]